MQLSFVVESFTIVLFSRKLDQPRVRSAILAIWSFQIKFFTGLHLQKPLTDTLIMEQIKIHRCEYPLLETDIVARMPSNSCLFVNNEQQFENLFYFPMSILVLHMVQRTNKLLIQNK